MLPKLFRSVQNKCLPVATIINSLCRILCYSQNTFAYVMFVRPPENIPELGPTHPAPWTGHNQITAVNTWHTLFLSSQSGPVAAKTPNISHCKNIMNCQKGWAMKAFFQESLLYKDGVLMALAPVSMWFHYGIGSFREAWGYLNRLCHFAYSWQSKRIFSKPTTPTRIYFLPLFPCHSQQSRPHVSTVLGDVGSIIGLIMSPSSSGNSFWVRHLIAQAWALHPRMRSHGPPYYYTLVISPRPLKKQRSGQKLRKSRV